MSQKIPRRGLLARLSMGVSTILAAPIMGKAASIQSGNEMNDPKHPILKVKPLGFQWETADPFLFCVHHDDRFPRGNDQMGPDASLDGRHIGQDFVIKDGWRMYHGERATFKL